MQKPKEIAEIALDLWYVPLERVAEVRELVRALRRDHGYDQPTDDSDEWSEEDLRDFTADSMRRFAEQHPDDDWGFDEGTQTPEPGKDDSGIGDRHAR